MDAHEVTNDGITYKRTNKPQARKAYNAGKTVWLVPSHVRFSFDHQWVRPFALHKESAMKQYELDAGSPDLDFDKRLRDYTWHTCCNELGSYVRFYVIAPEPEVAQKWEGEQTENTLF